MRAYINSWKEKVLPGPDIPSFFSWLRIYVNHLHRIFGLLTIKFESFHSFTFNFLNKSREKSYIKKDIVNSVSVSQQCPSYHTVFPSIYSNDRLPDALHNKPLPTHVLSPLGSHFCNASYTHTFRPRLPAIPNTNPPPFLFTPHPLNHFP